LKANFVADRLNLALVRPRTNDEKVGERRDARQVQHFDIDCFLGLGGPNGYEPGRGEGGDFAWLGEIGLGQNTLLTVSYYNRNFMRISTGWLLVSLCSGVLTAQTVPPDPQLTRARERLNQIRELVAAGAVPRAQLAKAQDEIADAEDAAFLSRTIYGKDLTDAQTDEMVAAAERRYQRRQAALEKQKELVDAGVATLLSLDPLQEDADLARNELDRARDRAQVVHELTVMAQAEQSLDERLENAPSTAHEIAERYDGDGSFTPKTFARVESAFEAKFGKPLPVSAMGETAVHRALGFNHTGRVDVAIHPDQPEGVWLREYLSSQHIPYFAFRQAVPGKATGAHIHMGPQSTRLAHGG